MADLRRKKRAKWIKFLIPPVITLVIFGCVLAVKGIFPFGTNRIDYYDMGQTNAPLYYHMWDFLHGKSDLFFDWFINEGQNLSMGSAIQWNISPFNLFFLFVPRNMIMKSLSIYMGLHLMAMTAAMYFFLNRLFPDTLYRWKALFSISYGLCGYTLTHYTIPTYLDTAVFFPLLALSLYRLLKEGKPYFYALMLGFTTALSYYLGFMHLIYILLFSGVWILFESGSVPGEEATLVKRDRAWKLGISTVLGLMLSCFMLLPALLQMSLSSRFNSNLEGGFLGTLLSIMNSIGADEYYVKWWQLYGLEAAGLLVILGILSRKMSRKRKITVFSLVFIPCALIPFESINILWHMGTYYHYPIRCAYLIPFSVLTAATYFVGILLPDCKHEGEVRERVHADKNQLASKLLPFFAVMISAVFLGLAIFLYIRGGIWTVQSLFRVWLVLAAGLFLFYLLLYLFSRKWEYTEKVFRPLFQHFTLPFVMAELILGAYIGYGCPQFTDTFFGDPEQSGDYVETAVELSERLPILEDETSNRLYRVKNPDSDLNTNYGMVMGRSTVTGWANTLTRGQQEAAEKAGYGTHFMRILDSGGTMFMDSALGVRKVLTRVPFEADSFIYEKIEETESSGGSYGLYDNKAAFPFVVAVSSEDTEIELEDLSMAQYQNALYRLFRGEDGEILKDLGKGEDSIKYVREEDGAIADSGSGKGPGWIRKSPELLKSPGRGQECTELVKGPGKPALQGEDNNNSETENTESLASEAGDSSTGKQVLREIEVKGNQALYLIHGQADEILVNGEPVPVPTIGDPDNTAYPAWFNSSLLYLGSFRDQRVSLVCPEKSRLFSLDLDLLMELSRFLAGADSRLTGGQKSEAGQAAVSSDRSLRGSDSESGLELSAGTSSLSFRIDGSEEKNVALLPLHCDPGFSATVNGKKQKVFDVAGLFMGIPIEQGENELELTFTPQGLVAGAVVSILGAILLLISFITGFLNRKTFSRVAFYIFNGVWALVLLGLYVIPIGWFIVHEIIKISGI